MTVANVMQMCTAIEFDSIELELNMKWILSIECSGHRPRSCSCRAGSPQSNWAIVNFHTIDTESMSSEAKRLSYYFQKAASPGR